MDLFCVLTLRLSWLKESSSRQSFVQNLSQNQLQIYTLSGLFGWEL